VTRLKLGRAELKRALGEAWGANTALENLPSQRIEELVASRYGREDWNLSR
jgi:hypothetical protein